MFEFFVARRYLVPKRGRGFLSLITWISVGGVCLGVLALIVVLAVMTGFEKEVKTRIVGTNAHITLLRYGTQGIREWQLVLDKVREHPEVTGATPFVYGKGMITAGGNTDGLIVKGIDLESEAEASEFLSYVNHRPGPLRLRPEEEGRLPGIILGVHIAANLQVTLGERVQVLSPQVGSPSPLGYVPKVRNFEVVGIFRSGMYEYDSSLAYVDLRDAQSLFSMGGNVTAIEARVRDMYRAPVVADELLEMLGGFPYRANDWIQLNANLFSWMQTEKRVMFVILALIVTVAAFNITGALIMMVKEKRRDIGILRSMGATSTQIRNLFVMEGAVIGVTGMVLGTAGGIFLCWLLETYEFIRLPGDIYFIDTLPVKVQALDVISILAAALAITLLATLYPATRAARMNPVEAIRHGE